MKLVRSWPLKPPDDHPRIFDNCDRIYIPTIDYSPLLQLNDNVLQLDWDVAVGQHELKEFATRCIAEPELVRVAPTMAYSTRQARWRATTGSPQEWMVWTIGPDGSRTLVEPGEPCCDVFSFGLVYLPRWTIEGFTDALRDEPEKTGPSFLDLNFGYWHHQITGGRGVPIEWGTNTVHINFSIRDTLKDL